MDKNPYIGQMDRLVIVQQEINTKNSTGEEVATFQEVARVWAFMHEQSGDEDVEGKVRHLIKRSYTIRYSTAIFSAVAPLSILDGTVKHEVYHIKEIGRRKHLQLLVTNYE